MKNKICIALAALVSVVSCQLSVAQTSIVLPPGTVITTNASGGLTIVSNPASTATSAPGASVGFLNQQLSTVFGLYDTNVDYYSGDKIQVGLRSSLSYNTANPGLEQELEPNFFYQFGDNLWIGDGFNFDTLGTQGTSIDALGDHVYFKYSSHNLAALFGIGFQRYEDLVANKNNIEVGGGLEGYISKYAGIFVHYNIGDDPFDHMPKGTSRIYGRLTTGLTFKLGK